jgi:hypothetical protein
MRSKDAQWGLQKRKSVKEFPQRAPKGARLVKSEGSEQDYKRGRGQKAKSE